MKPCLTNKPAHYRYSVLYPYLSACCPLTGLFHTLNNINYSIHLLAVLINDSGNRGSRLPTFINVNIYWVRHGHSCANAAQDDGFTFWSTNVFKGEQESDLSIDLCILVRCHMQPLSHTYICLVHYYYLHSFISMHILWNQDYCTFIT